MKTRFLTKERKKISPYKAPTEVRNLMYPRFKHHDNKKEKSELINKSNNSTKNQNIFSPNPNIQIKTQSRIRILRTVSSE